MHQGSLFPDAFEVLEQALAALKDIDVRRADELVRRARATQPNLVNLDVVEEACGWLRRALGDGPEPGPDACAAALRAVPDDVEGGRLREEAARFVDRVIARYLIRLGGDGSFVDRAECVPWARVWMIGNRWGAAHRSLVELVAERGSERADLWWALGDAAVRMERPAEANAAFVRALVIDPRGIDWFRLQHRGLRGCHEDLRVRHGVVLARELLLPNAWIDGVLEIPGGNGWFDAVPGGEAREGGSSGEAETERVRRFARLLFVDRTAGPEDVDIARREEMAELCPELFARYVAACRRREVR